MYIYMFVSIHIFVGFISTNYRCGDSPLTFNEHIWKKAMNAAEQDTRYLGRVN